MSNTTTFLVALLLGALVGGFAVYGLAKPAMEPTVTLPSDPQATSAQPAPLRTDVSVGPVETADGPAARPTAGMSAPSSEDLDRARTRNDQLRAEVAALEARLETESERPSIQARFTFGIPADAAAFVNADWKAMGGHLTKLTALLKEVYEGIGRGEEPSGAMQSRIKEQNDPLALFTIELAGDVADMTPNGAFVHPAVMANLLRAVVSDAGHPLSEDQERRLSVIGEKAVADLARMEARFEPTVPAIGKTAQLTARRLQFVNGLRGLLTPAQDAAAFPPETAGRLKLDLLSPVLVYVLSAPLVEMSRDALEATLLQHVLNAAGAPRDDLSGLQWIGAKWVDEVPGILDPLVKSDTPVLYFPHVDLCQTRAVAQAAAIERLAESGEFSSEEVERLRAVGMLYRGHLRSPTGE